MVEKIQPRQFGNNKPYRNNLNEEIKRLSCDIDCLFGKVKEIKKELGDLIHSYSRVEREFFLGLRGKDICIELINGELVEAKLLASDKFCLLLEYPKCCKPTLMMKSSVFSISEK